MEAAFAEWAKMEDELEQEGGPGRGVLGILPLLIIHRMVSRSQN